MESLGFAQLIDICFVALVTICCLSALASTSNRGENRAREWKRELEELRRSLELLISEAATASRSLDKSLSERQEQLADLLARIESSAEVRAAAELPRAKAPNRPVETAASAAQRPAADAFDPDSPNPSWERELPKASAPENDGSLRGQIEVTRQSAARAKKSDTRHVTIQRKRSIDPLAERVARRLLSRGQEIHIVARKLDLSLSDVRLIDRELREERGEIVDEPGDFQMLEPTDEIVSLDSGRAARQAGR